MSSIEEMDPMEALEQEVKKRNAEAKARSALSEARSMLILGKNPTHAFFAQLCLRLELEADWSIETAFVDGKTIFYNPDFINSLQDAEVRFIHCHEVMHCVTNYFKRAIGLHPGKANVASDLAINPLLEIPGFQAPEFGCFPGKGSFKDLPVGLSMEEYYRLLPDDKKFDSQDPGGCGAAKAGGKDQASTHATTEDWRSHVAAATEYAKKKGNLPAGLNRIIGDVLNPKIPWQHVLQEFISRKAKISISWNRPNRRHFGGGLYLPSKDGFAVSGLVLAVDTSGSMSQKDLTEIAGEVTGICQAANTDLTVLYHDAAVAGVQHWSPDDGPLVFKPVGGGGTCHKPVFDWCAKSDAEISGLICFTDLYSSFPKEAPPFPVLWVTNSKDKVGPFGRTIYL